MTPTNEEIHSSRDPLTSAGYTPLPFVGASSTSGAVSVDQAVLTPIWSEDWDMDAEPSWIHRNLTSHHFKPLLGVSDPGLSVTVYSSAYDAEEWAFVGPLVCVLSNVVVFAIDNLASLNSEDGLTRTADQLHACGKSLIFVVNKKDDVTEEARSELLKAIETRYGVHASICCFDFRDPLAASHLKSQILIQLLTELRRLRRARDVSASTLPLTRRSRLSLQEHSQFVDADILASIQALMAQITSTEEHHRVFLAHSSPEELELRLGAYLHLRLFGHIFKTLALRTLRKFGDIRASLSGELDVEALQILTPDDFSTILPPLYAWIAHHDAPKASSTALIAVGTASGATIALGALAMSMTAPAVMAAAASAAVIGASATYAAPSLSSLIPLPGKKKAPLSEEALRDSVLGRLIGQFATISSHHYTELRAAVLLILRKVFVAAQMENPEPVDYEWNDLATIDENYLDVTLPNKTASLASSLASREAS